MKCQKGLELKVLKSEAGFYIGTTENGLPHCRLSRNYYETEKEAEEALNNNTFRDRHAVEIQFCNRGNGCL